MSDRVSVAILHGSYEPLTVGAVAAMTAYDLRSGGKYLNHDEFFIQVGTTDIANGRNLAARAVLDSGVEWLLFLDSDETWNPDIVDRLMASADKDERPIISGLIMANRPERDLPIAPACGIFDDGDTARIVSPTSIPNVRWWNVATIGAGCLLIHRSVLEAIEAKFADHPSALWFDQLPFTWTERDGTPVIDRMGEDYVFSSRATACGYPLIVDTTIELGHIKRVTFTRDMFHRQMAQHGQRPTFVVIPVKDKLELTESVVAQLREQGGYDGLFIYDNGSGAQTKEWLKHQSDILTWDAKGAGIHQMWNAGINQALRRSGGSCDIIFLNNDLILGPDFCSGLVDALGSGDWAAVSANYDARDGEGEVQRVRGICAERYDGTGGLAGFAFAVRGEFFTSYRFPDDCKWWYGDNDLCLTMDLMGAPYGIATGVAVEHIGAGTAKDWSDKKWASQLEADRLAFERKWSQLGAVA